MRKYGKYESKSEGVPVKQTKVRSALLQTYLTSLLCMVLCVTMFFGTSYAWFTSEVTNTGNEIYIGKLDVGLFAGDKDLSVSGNKLFDSTNIRWEPGYTALETIKVVDEGDLAFKYALTFTDGSPAAGSTSSIGDIAKWFDVWVYNGTNKPNNYVAITAVDSGWKPVGTLAEVLGGKTVLEGKMEEADVVNTNTTHTYTIALHMNGEQVAADQENALNALMGQRISLTVKLVAHQMASETDGFGNSQYDKMVITAAQLTDALEAGGTVALAADINIPSAEERVTMNGGVLNGNGKTISYTVSKGADDPSLGVVTTTGGTVKSLTIEGGTAGRALYITTLASDLVVSDCTLDGVYAFNLNSAVDTEHTMTFTNTVFKAWTSYANVTKLASFKDCCFEAVLKPYGATKLENCTFTQDSSLYVSALEENETIELLNCTFGTVVIPYAILKAEIVEGTLQVTCDNSLVTVADGKLVIQGSNS